MLNLNSEVFVIYYPYGAGGRLLQMLISLDPRMCGIDNRPRQGDIYNQYFNTVTKNDRAHWFAGTVPFDHHEIFAPADRYVFQFHNSGIDFPDAVHTFSQVRDLRPIFISVNNINSAELLRRRRLGLSQSPPDSAGVAFSSDERTVCAWSQQLCHYWLRVYPALTIELIDFWNPLAIKPILDKFFQRYNLNCEGWRELYDAWHAHTIAPYV